MRILFPYMARWHAVNWTRYHSLLVELANRGHEVFVLQPPPLKSAETNFQEIPHVDQKNLQLMEVKTPGKIWNTKFPLDKLVKKALFCVCAYKQAKEVVAQESIDVVLLYNIPQYQFSGIDNVIQIFDYADDYIDMLEAELGKLSSLPFLGVARNMLSRMMSRADVTLSVSHELAKQVKGNSAVLPNGVSPEKSNSALSISVEVNNQDKPIVGFIGSFEYFIDFDIIIEAAQSLPEYHFLLVGTGRDWQDVKDKVENLGLQNVELTGGVPHKEVFAYINAMDICLNIFKPIPVSHRACPLKLFEYMGLRKPVVSTRLHELKHIDEDFLFYADDSKELISSIREISANPQKSQDMLERGFDKTMNQYTWGKLAEQFEGIVDKLTQEKRANV